MPVHETFRNQQDLIAPADLDGLDVDLVGAGMLGGAILLCLCKMGFGILNRIVVTDFDRCEAHNLPTQWFRAADVAMERAKAEALVELVAWIAERRIEPVVDRFTGGEDRALSPIVILAVDTLAERRAIWRRLCTRRDVELVVDARTGAEVFEVHLVRPGSPEAEAYEQTLEGEPAEDPCTRRAIAYTPLAAAAATGSLLRSWVRRQETPHRVTMDLRNFLVERHPPA